MKLAEYSKELNCHSGTTKKEIFDFLENHKGKSIIIHYEHNLIDGWGNDDMWEVKLINENLTKVYNLVATRYIHNIFVK